MTMHIKPPAVRLVAPGGPVSNALRVMSAAHRTPVLAPEFDPERAEIHRLRETLRTQIERDFDRIDRCLAFLDAIDGDADSEPYLAGYDIEGGDDRECDAGEEPEITANETHGGGFPLSVYDHDDEDSHDRESGTDDNGLADHAGYQEQFILRAGYPVARRA